MNQQTDMLEGKRQSYPCRMTGNEAENSSGKIQIRREMIYEDPYSKGLPHKGFSESWSINHFSWGGLKRPAQHLDQDHSGHRCWDAHCSLRQAEHKETPNQSTRGDKGPTQQPENQERQRLGTVASGRLQGLTTENSEWRVKGHRWTVGKPGQGLR